MVLKTQEFKIGANGNNCFFFNQNGLGPFNNIILFRPEMFQVYV